MIYGAKFFLGIVLLCGSVGCVLGMQQPSSNNDKRNGGWEEDDIPNLGKSEQQSQKFDESSSGVVRVLNGATWVISGLSEVAFSGVATVWRYAQGEPLVAPDILNAPWSEREAQRWVERSDYERLTEYLYTQIDKKKSAEAIAWVRLQAQLGVIPCFYFDIRNRIHMLDGGTTFTSDEITIFARDIMIFLTLIELDIATWFYSVGERETGQLQRVSGVYVLFKNKIQTLLYNHRNIFTGVELEIILTMVKEWFASKGLSLLYRPCVWVAHCSENQSMVPGKKRIFYGLISETEREAHMRPERIEHVKALHAKLLPKVHDELQRHAPLKKPFIIFMAEQAEFQSDWFRSLLTEPKKR